MNVMSISQQVNVETDEEMSAEYPKSRDNSTIPKEMKRIDVLKITAECIQYLKKKAIAGRLIDTELEKLRDSKMRLLLEACKVHGSLLKDQEIDNLEARVADLEGGST